MKYRVANSGTDRKRQSGQAAVEFALTITSIFVLLIGMLELTMFVYTYSVLADAAKEGVRYAIVHGSSGQNGTGPSGGGSCVTSGAVIDNVKYYAAGSLHGTSNMTVNACYTDGNNQPGSAVQVTVSYPYEPFFGLGWPTVNVYANSAGRIMF